MTPTQREAALRLADALPGGQLYMRPWAEEAAALLRKLASKPHYTITWDAQGRRLVNGDLAPEHRMTEPVQEPVCWGWRVPDGRITMIFSERKDNPDLEVVPLFTHPPQQRKPLSEEQMKEVMSAAGVRVFQPGLWDVLVEAGRSIERHYGIGEAP